MIAAPRMTPRRLPTPPRMTIARMLIDSWKRKLSGKTERCHDARRPAAGERGADGESLQLRDSRVDAHGLCREFVLSDRLPGPPNARIAQPRRGDEHETERRDKEVVVLRVAARHEPAQGGRVDRDDPARPARDVDRP